MWDNLTVKGFQFDSTEGYLEARKEAEAIDYICQKMNVNDPQIALKVYYKLLERQNLKTVVGVVFLKELRDRIIEAGIVEDKNLKFIHTECPLLSSKVYKEYGDEEALSTDTVHREESVENIDSAADIKDDSISEDAKTKSDAHNDISLQNAGEIRKNTRESKLNSVIEYYKGKVKTFKIAIAVLILVIIAMFVITLNSDNSPFIDAEVKIQDKYAGWAEELQQWESELEAREGALNESR